MGPRDELIPRMGPGVFRDFGKLVGVVVDKKGRVFAFYYPGRGCSCFGISALKAPPLPACDIL